MTLPQRDADRIARSLALNKAVDLHIQRDAGNADNIVDSATKFLAFLNNTMTVDRELVKFANWMQDNRTRTLGKDFTDIVAEYLEAVE